MFESVSAISAETQNLLERRLLVNRLSWLPVRRCWKLIPNCYEPDD
jgi:hypothetical protein